MGDRNHNRESFPHSYRDRLHSRLRPRLNEIYAEGDASSVTFSRHRRDARAIRGMHKTGAKTCRDFRRNRCLPEAKSTSGGSSIFATELLISEGAVESREELLNVSS